jgi:hypothetical protein
MAKKVTTVKPRVKQKNEARLAVVGSSPPIYHSIFHQLNNPATFPTIRAELEKFYGNERLEGRKTVPALKGRELETKVKQQMRFLHPGMGAA